MKLDRNLNADGKGKYALVRMRGNWTEAEKHALSVLDAAGRVDFGNIKDIDEFFVIKLRDKYAADALAMYAAAARIDDPEYAAEVMEMAGRAGENHPCCKRPD